MMSMLRFRNRLLFTILVTTLIWLKLSWDHFHDGVNVHYLLHDENLPSFSDWWSGLLLPAFTWLMLYLIYKREGQNEGTGRPVVSRLFISLLFGITLSVFFTLGYEQPPAYMMLSVIVLSLFIPLYLPEYFLGFVLSMSYTFGTPLSLIIGSVMIVILLFNYKIVRNLTLKLINLSRTSNKQVP